MDSKHVNGVVEIMEEKFNTESSGSCRLCRHISVKRCKRCGDYYCSEKCQYVDWPNHRYICFPIPQLVISRDVKNEDTFFCTNPPELTENNLIKELGEFRTTIDIIMEKLERIEDKIAESIVEKSGVKSSVKSHGTEEVNDDLAIHKGTKCLENASDAPKEPEKHINDSYDLKQSTSSETADTDRVVLSAFRSTNRCVIRKKDAKTERAFHSVIDQINEYGRNAAPLETLPTIGSLAIAQKSNKHYARVKVLKKNNENKFNVQFCDFGNVVYRKPADLRVITDEISNLPIYVSTVQLHGVEMLWYSESIWEFIKQFENKDYRIEYMHKNGDALVKLYDIKTDQLLNDVILKFYSEIDKTPKTVRIRQISHSNKSKLFIEKIDSITTKELKNENIIDPPFQTQLFAANSGNFEATVVDTILIDCGYMACVSKDNISYFLSINNALNNMEIDKEPYEPKLNEYCIAQYENEWFRGRVVNIDGDGTQFDICNIDCFTEVTVTKDYIRPYPKDLKFDCCTTLCKIDNLPKNMQDKHRKFLQSKIKINDEIFINRVIQLTGQVALVECSQIIMDMHAENLI